MSDKPEPRASDSALADELEAMAKAMAERHWEGSLGYKWSNIIEAERNEYRADASAAHAALSALRSNAGKASHE